MIGIVCGHMTKCTPSVHLTFQLADYILDNTLIKKPVLGEQNASWPRENTLLGNAHLDRQLRFINATRKRRRELLNQLIAFFAKNNIEVRR